VEIAITGASGLIGRALTTSLRTAGHRVRAVTRGAATTADGIEWDPERGTIDAAAFESVDAVVHLAGEGIAEHKWNDEQKRRILESRVRGTELLASTLAACARPPAILVSGSALGYYGNRGDEQLRESSAPGTDFLATVCTAWEASTAPASEVGIRVAHIRTGIVLAAKGGALGKMVLPFKLGLGGRIGNGTQWMSWISLRDEVRAIEHVLDRDVHGPVNLVAPAPVRNREFVATLGRVLRRPTVLPTPLLPLEVRYGKELVDALLRYSIRARCDVLEQSGFEFEHPDLERALRSEFNRPG